jgi:peptide deformylase
VFGLNDKLGKQSMILPIYGYGHPVLKKAGTEIAPDYPDFAGLMTNVWETMYRADGIGLAAPQIGLAIRLFVIDTLHIEREIFIESDQPLKKAFINAKILEETGEKWSFEEGCLSIPKVRGLVERHPVIHISYLDEAFQPHEETFSGINARVIQHEYDHIEGKLFTDHLSPFKRRLMAKKLEAIKQGRISPEYKMRYAHPS